MSGESDRKRNEREWMKMVLTLSQHDCVDGCHVQRKDRQRVDPTTTNTHCAGDKSFNHSTTEHPGDKNAASAGEG